MGKQVANGGLTFHPLWWDHIALYAGGGGAVPHRIEVGDLRQVPLVLREEGSGTRRAVERALPPLGVSLDACAVVAEFGSTTAVKQAVAAGLGAGFLSDVSVAAELASGVLRRVEVAGFEAIPRRFFAVWDPERAPSPATARFREALLAAAGEP